MIALTLFLLNTFLIVSEDILIQYLSKICFLILILQYHVAPLSTRMSSSQSRRSFLLSSHFGRREISSRSQSLALLMHFLEQLIISATLLIFHLFCSNILRAIDLATFSPSSFLNSVYNIFMGMGVKCN